MNITEQAFLLDNKEYLDFEGEEDGPDRLQCNTTREANFLQGISINGGSW